jgi:hypothetical protein
MIVVLAHVLAAPPVRAAEIVSFLAIEGTGGPGDAGEYPLDADFSWTSHRFPGNTSAHIWTLAPGSDGGIAMNTAQPGRGQITAKRAMYNLNSWLFSTGSGIQYQSQTAVLDFTNLRLAWGEDIYDFGFGTTTSGLVPRVVGAGEVASANGWWLDSAGKYHLILRGEGQCVGCELTVHLTGQRTAVVVGDIAPAGMPDGQLNVADLMRLMRFVIALETPVGQELVSADINGDGVLDVRDVLAFATMLGY